MHYSIKALQFSFILASHIAKSLDLFLIQSLVNINPFFPRPSSSEASVLLACAFQHPTFSLPKMTVPQLPLAHKTVLQPTHYTSLTESTDTCAAIPVTVIRRHFCSLMVFGMMLLKTICAMSQAIVTRPGLQRLSVLCAEFRYLVYRAIEKYRFISNCRDIAAQ